MKVCLDTNVFVQIFSLQPPFPQILDAFVHGRFEMLVTTEILLEYEEVVVREFGHRRWNMAWALIQRVQSLHATVLQIEPHFRFAVISTDPDDNKFVDCAIAGGAELIITADRHFSEVQKSGYNLRILTAQDFALHHL
jgi:uncharacterized protein